jgi:hypothetical protein
MVLDGPRTITEVAGQIPIPVLDLPGQSGNGVHTVVHGHRLLLLRAWFRNLKNHAMAVLISQRHAI